MSQPLSPQLDPLRELEKIEKAARDAVEKGRKKYRVARAVAAVLVQIFALVSGVIVGTYGSQSSSGVVIQAGQSLITVAAFLAASSGAVAFFYYGKLLELFGPSSTMMQVVRLKIRLAVETKAKKSVEDEMKGLIAEIGATKTFSEKELERLRGTVYIALGNMTKLIYNEASKAMKDLLQAPRRTAYYAAVTFVTLVISTFFSSLAILTGSGSYLGWAFGFIALGSGALALTWSDAHTNITSTLTSAQIYEAIREMPTPAPAKIG